MDTASSTLPSGALRRALVQARTDPQVEAIARSLHVNLADESVWQRILGQAERNYQLGLAAASGLNSGAGPEEGAVSLSYSHAAAISAYQTIDRL